jgi:polyether ionophore transport system permease protein
MSPTRSDGGRAVVRLCTRLTRRGTAVLAASLAAYAAVEMVSYTKAYPDAASRERITTFGEIGATRALQGVPHGTETVGGFVAWDAGWVLQTIIAVWAILLTGRLLRGEEEDGRADWVLAGPVRPARALLSQLAVLASATVLVVLALTSTLLLGGAEPVGSLLLGAALAGFGVFFVAVSAVAGQLFGLRRRAVAAASAVLGVAYVVRVVADSADSRGWLRLLTPFGWTEELEPFAARRWPVLGLFVLVPAVLTVVAVVLRGRRDLGSAVIGGADRHPPRLRLLSTPEGFAWRSAEGVLLSWTLGLGTYSFVMGSLVHGMTDYLASDPSFQQTMKSLGMGLAITPDGFVGVIAVTLAVGFSMYACWRIAAARAEEAAGRAELVLSRRVTRVRWLAGQVAGALAALAAVLTVCTVALWAGAVSTGAGVSFRAAAQAMGNTAPAAIVFAGLAVVILAVLPRTTAVLPVTLVVVSYLLHVVGPPLELPGWLLDLSAFHHLAYVPAQPFALAEATCLVAIGVAAAATGVVAFRARDLRGA